VAFTPFELKISLTELFLSSSSRAQYTEGEPVSVWINKVGPYHNPQETYSYNSLPWCMPSVQLEPAARLGDLGEILEGSELHNSNLNLKFGGEPRARIALPGPVVGMGPGSLFATAQFAPCPPLHEKPCGLLAADVRCAYTLSSFPFRSSVAETIDHAPVCSMTLDEAGAQLMAYAVSNHYWYQLYLDELPIWGMVGEIMADEDVLSEIESQTGPHGIADATFLYTHKSFTIGYNGNQIVEVNMTSENAVPIEAGKKYEMTYSVHWLPSGALFAQRFDRYLDANFFEHQVHWFSLFNSFMMVIFLCGVVAIILMRTLKADYARYMPEDDMEGGVDKGQQGFLDDGGWKQVRADVFRRPANVVLHSALVGSGYQLMLLAFVMIGSAIAGSLYVDRGALTGAFLLGYAVTSAVSGFMSGAYYRSFFAPEPSPQWIRVMLLTSSLFPALCLLIAFLLNIVAMGYGSTSYLSFSTLLKVVAIWLFISVPLTVGGTIMGRRFGPAYAALFRVNPIPREIPPRPWYTGSLVMCVLAGFLPFASAFIELYFLLTSFWNYKVYYVYGFMLAVYLILALVVSCVSVVSTYILLNSEDHRWQWHAFAAGASTALYIFCYAIYYFIFRTE
jgi:transmembrane 9 superfamily protein 3